MNIIERLCIEPIKSIPCSLYKVTPFNLNEVREVEQQRNELLEALIDLTNSKYHDDYYACRVNGWSEKESKEKALLYIKEYTDIIEKATGKTWEEIKELLD